MHGLGFASKNLDLTNFYTLAPALFIQRYYSIFAYESMGLDIQSRTRADSSGLSTFDHS